MIIWGTGPVPFAVPAWIPVSVAIVTILPDSNSLIRKKANKNATMLAGIVAIPHKGDI